MIASRGGKIKILNISNMPLWLWGEGKGMPSILFPQKGFAKRGYEVYFLCPLKEGEDRYSLTAGIHVYRFDFPFNFRKNIYLQTNNILNRWKGSLWHSLNWLFFQVVGFFWGIKIGLRIKPDIIYAHSPASVLSAYLASKLLSARFIIRLYGVRQLYWHWQSFWFRIKEFRDYFVFKIPADYFVILNDGTHGNLIAKKLGVPDEKIKYWREGIDQDIYEPEGNAKIEICQYLNIPPSFKFIVSTARLNYEYGVDRLLSILVDLFKKNRDTICLIAGSGPERRRFENFVRDNHISSRVFFLGIVDRQMIRKILNAADIFVLVSRYHNCTNTMWEAMACGKCIVTTETDAIKEVLTSGENAILISKEKINEASPILEGLLKNDQWREKLGQRARLRAREVLESWPERIEKEAQLLEGLLKKSEK